MLEALAMLVVLLVAPAGKVLARGRDAAAKFCVAGLCLESGEVDKW